MATMRASVGGLVTPLPARVAAFKPVARVQRTSCVVEAMSKSQVSQKATSSETKVLQAGSSAAAFSMATALVAQQAQAANEVSELAAGDNRLLILTVIFVPALGWVAFNILGPALNQLANMATQNAGGGGKKGGKKGGRR